MSDRVTFGVNEPDMKWYYRFDSGTAINKRGGFKTFGEAVNDFYQQELRGLQSEPFFDDRGES